MSPVTKYDKGFQSNQSSNWEYDCQVWGWKLLAFMFQSIFMGVQQLQIFLSKSIGMKFPSPMVGIVYYLRFCIQVCEKN